MLLYQSATYDDSASASKKSGVLFFHGKIDEKHFVNKGPDRV